MNHYNSHYNSRPLTWSTASKREKIVSVLYCLATLVIFAFLGVLLAVKG